jgi:hypothetical protein
VRTERKRLGDKKVSGVEKEFLGKEGVSGKARSGSELGEPIRLIVTGRSTHGKFPRQLHTYYVQLQRRRGKGTKRGGAPARRFQAMRARNCVVGRDEYPSPDISGTD